MRNRLGEGVYLGPELVVIDYVRKVIFGKSPRLLSQKSVSSLQTISERASAMFGEGLDAYNASNALAFCCDE